MHDSPTRRRVLQSASVVGGAFALAGCLGSAAPVETTAPTESVTETPRETETTEAEPQADTSVEEWLLASNVLGDGADRLFQNEVRVGVGSPRVPYAFHPTDLRVSPGTTVVWYWTPHGGANNVVALDGSFDSGDPVENAGTTFSHTFDEPGTYRYVSQSHSDCGMRGVVRVREPPESGYPAVDRWLVDVGHYDGTVVDETGRSAVSVTVAAENLNDGLSFDPPAMKVSPETTVRWEWTGAGGAHDVVFDEADIEGSPLQPDEGATYEYTFDSPGVYRYTCRPHQFVGQKGAIVVD